MLKPNKLLDARLERQKVKQQKNIPSKYFSLAEETKEHLGLKKVKYNLSSYYYIFALTVLLLSYTTKLSPNHINQQNN